MAVDPYKAGRAHVRKCGYQTGNGIQGQPATATGVSSAPLLTEETTLADGPPAYLVPDHHRCVGRRSRQPIRGWSRRSESGNR
jgi:hypothetical protein